MTEYSFPIHRPAHAGTDQAVELFGIVPPHSAGEVIGQLAIGVDLSYLHTARRGLIYRAVISVVSGSAVAMLLGFLLVRVLLRRSIDPLLAGIQEIGAGNLSHRVELTSRDEIGDIGKAFDEMADRLSATLISKQDLEETVKNRTADLEEAIAERRLAAEALKKLNDELELRVAQRTVELEESHQELELQNEELQEAYRELERETEERVRMMEELGEKDRMLLQQSRMAAMGELLGNMAHQWRQPLNALGLIIQQVGVSHECGGFDKRLLDTNIDKAMEIILHLSRTIDDFRLFSLPDQNGKGEFRVDEVVGKTIALIGDSFREQHITIETSTRAEPRIIGNPNEYAQVLLNILMNARDALRQKGVAGAHIAVDVSTEDGRSVVRITDNAGGIKKEIIDKIFDPFFTTKELGKGAGVGLFMAKTIIEQNMAGSLTAQNVNQGAEFRIEV